MLEKEIFFGSITRDRTRAVKVILFLDNKNYLQKSIWIFLAPISDRFLMEYPLKTLNHLRIFI